MTLPSFNAGCIAVLAVFLTVASRAHPGPEHEIEELTEQIKIQGPSPDLLLRRAVEYRVLGNLTEATKDLERAAESDGSSVGIQRELGQAYFSLGKTNEALRLITAAIRLPSDPVEQASLLMTRSGILQARKDYAKALEDANAAIAHHKANVEWYLARSQLQALLNLKTERVRGLEEGLHQTGSGLLLNEWVDALIANGQHEAARARIDQELERSRWQSSWLIRRSKVRLATGARQDGLEDLRTAIDELNLRLSASAADALLLADRAHAYELLGQREEARRDYRAARDRGLTDDWVRDRIRALRGPADESD